MSVKRSATKKFSNAEGLQGDINLRGAMGGQIVDEYAEPLRPNLYNVIKKLKET